MASKGDSLSVPALVKLLSSRALFIALGILPLFTRAALADGADAVLALFGVPFILVLVVGAVGAVLILNETMKGFKTTIGRKSIVGLFLYLLGFVLLAGFSSDIQASYIKARVAGVSVGPDRSNTGCYRIVVQLFGTGLYSGRRVLHVSPTIFADKATAERAASKFPKGMAVGIFVGDHETNLVDSREGQRLSAQRTVFQLVPLAILLFGVALFSLGYRSARDRGLALMVCIILAVIPFAIALIAGTFSSIYLR